MTSPQDLGIEIDLELGRQRADAAKRLLVNLRGRYDLSAWEYTKKVRIAPFETPHSHPVLTLNARLVEDEDAFLATYLHEQIHWALALHRRRETELAIEQLRDCYPNAHAAFPKTARSEQSTYLHLVVNWIEVLAVSEAIGRERAEAQTRRRRIYTWIYETVLEDWDKIEIILKSAKTLPIPTAAGSHSSDGIG